MNDELGSRVRFSHVQFGPFWIPKPLGTLLLGSGIGEKSAAMLAAAWVVAGDRSLRSFFTNRLRWHLKVDGRRLH